MDYFSIHNHTEYSNLRLLDCINKVEDLIDYAHQIGLSGVCITDHEALSAHIKALKYVKKKKQDNPDDESWQNFKLGLGNEIYLCRNGLSSETYQKGEKFPHFILIAKDKIGHAQLRQLSSRAWSHSFTMFLTRVPTYYNDVEEIIGSNPGHIIASSACIGSWLGINYNNNNLDVGIPFIKWCKKTFGEDNFYLELQPAQYKEQIGYNKRLLFLAKETNTKCIVTTDTHYLKESDRNIHASFLNSKEGDRETSEFYQYTYMMKPEEIIDKMKDYISEDVIQDFFNNTNDIKNQIEDYDLAQPQIVPHLSDDRKYNPKWKDIYGHFKIRSKFEYLNKYYYSSSEDDNYLIYLGLTKLNELKLSPEKREQYLERLETELTECWLVSERLGQPISSYLLMVRNIIQIMWQKAESLVGVSRGSAGVMLINYLIGVTQMNPMEQGVYLPHWRFLQRNKIELPDIDVDSEGRRRPLVLQKIKEAAKADGGDSVCVCTFGTLGTRSAILTAARGLGIDVDEAQYLATMIPQERGFLWPLKDCLEGNLDKDRKPITQLINEFNKYPGFLEVTKAIEGLVCQMGIHACFDAQTKIKCKDGVKEIKNIAVGDFVLTIDGSYHKVLQTMENDTEELYTLYSKGIIEPLTATPNHPIRILRDGEEMWCPVEQLRDDDYIGTPLNQNNVPFNWDLNIPISNDLLWFLGRFVGDGWIEERRRNGKYLDCDKDILLCCNKKDNEREEIEERLQKIGLKYRISEAKTTYKIVIHNLPLLKWMRIFGKGAYNKTIPNIILDLPREELESFVEGYVSADGHINQSGTSSFKTISPSLALGMNIIYNKLNHNYITNNIQDTEGTEIIEERKVSSHKRYCGLMSKIKRNWQPMIHNNKIWFKIDKIEYKQRNQKVYNLEVEGNHTYTANGVIVHNCGNVIFNVPIYTYNAMMKAPNGTEVTQFDLGDTEYMGGLKMDCLSVEALDKIHTTLDLLLEDGLIEWQGDLKSTYDKYLHPDVLVRDDPEMWHKVWRNEIIDIFQMDSTVGKQSLSLVKPENIPQMAAVNSLMRLMPEKGQKTPTEEYVMYKQHPELIKKEIYDLNATDKEKEILYNFMKDYTGVLESQESVMLAVMIPEFTNYDVPHANKIRKIIAKKKMKEIASAREEYFETGKKNGVSEDILKYIWDVQIKRQLGYSFSIPHTVAYSLIALQEMNLNTLFPPIYWATACLTVNSGASDEEAGGTTNYGKLSSAIGRIQAQGIKVELPNINLARFGFTPDNENNSIIYGLKGISDVGDTVINKIIDNRPYKSFQNFMEKVEPSKSQCISLIKAGCFDSLENTITRKELMYNYLKSINPPKTRITLQNMNGLINNNLLPKNKMGYAKLYNFNKYLKAFAKDDKMILDDRAYKYFSDHFDIDILHQTKTRTYIYKTDWEKLYKDKMVDFKEYLKNNQDKYINILQEAEIQNIWDESCAGSLSAWEMEALGFYYHDHELKNCSHIEFTFNNFYDLPEIPVADHYIKYKGRDIPVFNLRTICGTVLDKNSYKHTVTLLTPDGVVTVKCVAEQYSQYDKQISKLNKATGKKEVLEKSWFKRGTKLIVNGWRNADQFLARSRQSEEKHAFYKILDISDAGELEITRYRCESD